MGTIVRFRPMPGFLVVSPDQQQELRDSGLFTPKNYVRREVVGTVMAVGLSHQDSYGHTLNLVDSEDRQIIAGDRIVWKQNAGVGIEKDGDIDLIFLHFTDVLARVADKGEDLDVFSVDIPVRDIFSL